jgi:hypothetical protein
MALFQNVSREYLAVDVETCRQLCDDTALILRVYSAVGCVFRPISVTDSISPHKVILRYELRILKNRRIGGCVGVFVIPLLQIVTKHV